MPLFTEFNDYNPAEQNVINLSIAQRFDFNVFQGDTQTSTVTLVDALSGLPIDLTGSTAALELRISKEDALAAYTFSTANAQLLINGGPPPNVITINDWSSIPVGDYYYHLRVTDSTGAVKTYIYGRINVGN